MFIGLIMSEIQPFKVSKSYQKIQERLDKCSAIHMYFYVNLHCILFKIDPINTKLDGF